MTTPERWARIEQLYHDGARARPADDARGVSGTTPARGDDALRAEVESLLAQDGWRRGFLSAPARSRRTAGPADGRLIGQRARDRTRSRRCSAPAAWARCTARATRSSGATSRSRSCPRRSPPIPSGWRASSARRACSRRSTIRTSPRSTASRRPTASQSRSCWSWSRARRSPSGSRRRGRDCRSTRR